MNATRDSALCIRSILLMWSLSSVMAFCQTGTQREYEIKQGALYKVIQNVDWPAGSATNASQNLHVGLLGEIPFVEALEILDGKTIHGRKLVLKRISAAEAPRCQVIFIGASEKPRLAEILAGLDDRPVLTVGEVEGFAQKGGMVNLLAEANKVSLEINPRAASRVGLNIGSQLLSRAKVYTR